MKQLDTPRRRRSILADWQLYVMFLPAAILLVIFAYVPMYGLVLAFKDFNPLKGVLGSEWVGLEHFQTIVEDEYFYKVLGNTVWLNILNLIFGFPVPIILAILLNEVKNKFFKRTIQTLSYLPHFISWVIVAGILINILSIEDGIVNEIIKFFGGDPVNFFGNPDNFLAMLVVSDIWKGAGWGTIIYFAAISNISPELYEAAMIDGAGRFRRILAIVIPALGPAISINLIFRVSDLLASNFNQIFNLYNPVVYETADVVNTYIYRIGITDGNYGVSTALGLLFSVVSLVLILVTNKIIRKCGGEGIW